MESNSKKIALLILTFITISHVTTHARSGWGGGFAAGALTGVAVTGVAVAASRPHYSDDTYKNKSKCRKAIRALEKENDELMNENDELRMENDDLIQENKRLRRKAR